jgi:hypothetical protein
MSKIIEEQNQKEKEKGTKQWMQCSNRSFCSQSCGHKEKHLKNTACVNACAEVPGQICCKPCSKP